MTRPAVDQTLTRTPTVELVRTWVEKLTGGQLRLMVAGIVNGREHQAIVMTSGDGGRSGADVLDAHRQLRRQIARMAR